MRGCQLAAACLESLSICMRSREFRSKLDTIVIDKELFLVETVSKELAHLLKLWSKTQQAEKFEILVEILVEIVVKPQYAEKFETGV